MRDSAQVTGPGATIRMIAAMSSRANTLNRRMCSRTANAYCRARTKRGLTQSRKRHQRIGFPAIGSKGSLASILSVRPLMFRGFAGGSS